MAQKLVAFHGQQVVKDKYLARVQAHVKADELIHGTYWEKGKGCAVGCTVHSGDHAAYEAELGIPRLLARLEDGIFESLPNGDSKLWPGKFLSAIPVGADLSLVWPQFAVWLLTDEKFGVLQYAKSVRGKKVIQDVANAYQRVVEGGTDEINWYKLRDTADYATAGAADYATTAAAYAADAAADYATAAADYAADAAADYATAAADYAADYAAAYAADAAAYARINTRKAQAEKLLELLAASPFAVISA